MYFIKQKAERLLPVELNGGDFYKQIEIAGRTCYKSEDKITDTSAEKFCEMLVGRGHVAMIEHATNISYRITTNRAITHEIVRHRLFSFAQESTRYVDYNKKGICIIIPHWIPEMIGTLLEETEINEKDGIDTNEYAIIRQEIIDNLCENEKTKLEPIMLWLANMVGTAQYYALLRECGLAPQDARGILPNDLKAEIVVTGNIREWVNFFKLRVDNAAHPQIREVACMIFDELYKEIPVLLQEIDREKVII